MIYYNNLVILVINFSDHSGAAAGKQEKDMEDRSAH